MINFSNSISAHFGTNVLHKLQRVCDSARIEAATQRSLYVFLANPTREADVYLTPDIEHVDAFVDQITHQFLDTSLAVEVIGNNLPQELWIGLKLRYINRMPEDSATIVVLTWMLINNLLAL